MKGTILSSVAVLASLATAFTNPEVPYQRGFNLGTKDAQGTCKTTQEWANEFSQLQTWDQGQFTNVKLFTASDCDALNVAAPAAISTGTKIWVGVWAFPNQDQWYAEKEALERAIRAYGSDWIAGINVGSEALYREEINPYVLAERIYDVKGMVQLGLGGENIPVGSADTWTAWVNPVNQPVIQASDVILMNGFPYWQGADINQALGVFQASIANTRAAIGNKPFVVGETGWPTAGNNFGAAIPSTQNLQAYWSAAACYLQQEGISFYWFEGYDEPTKASGVEQNFGVANADGQLKIDLSC